MYLEIVSDTSYVGLSIPNIIAIWATIKKPYQKQYLIELFLLLQVRFCVYSGFKECYSYQDNRNCNKYDPRTDWLQEDACNESFASQQPHLSLMRLKIPFPSC